MYEWWRRRTTRVGLGLALVLFGAPALSGLLGRLLKESAWLNDWNALVCGAIHANAGVALYGTECEGIRGAPYVYAPWVARALAPVLDAIGQSALNLIYAPLLAASMLLLAWMGFVRPLAGSDWRDRIPFLALLTGSALACGNISYPLHGLIAAAALFLPRRRVLFIAAVAAACAVKPMFATFLCVLLLEERPLHRRVLTGLWAGLVCVGIAAAIIWFAGAERALWTASIEVTVLDQLSQSVGFFGWWTYFGAPPNLAMYAAYILYAAAMLSAAYFIVERGALDTTARIAFGLGLAGLLNPRLMDYDLLLLAPAPVLAAAALRTLAPAQARLLWTLAAFACAAALLLNLADMVPLGLHLAPPIFAALIVVAGVQSARLRGA